MREPLKQTTISFVACSAEDCKRGFKWARDKQLPDRCPKCWSDSVTGHGWRTKQAHDEHHVRIRYRRGECQNCHVTVSFLPAFSLPYTHYSLVARSEALRRRFVEGLSWEDAAPLLKDPDRGAAPSTLRRWCRSLDASSPAFCFLRRALQIMAPWLECGESPIFGSLRLSWLTLYPCLQIAWPWPLRL